MYGRSSRYYDLFYSFVDYPGTSASLLELIKEHRPQAQTLLDVACGTGQFLRYAGEHYRTAGVDINPELLEMAAERCPGVPLHMGDMSAFQLQSQFDVVTCLFRSIAYVKTEERMRAAIARMAAQLAPGGLLIIEPYFTPEQYWVNDLRANFINLPDVKIAWMYVSKLQDALSVLDIHHLIGTRDGMESFSERHELGLFTEQQMQDAFENAGLTATFHPGLGVAKCGIYVAERAS